MNNSRFPSHTPSRSLISRDPHCRVFFSPDDGANNPGGDNSATPPAANPQPGKSVAELVQEEMLRLLGKNNNDPNAAMTTLIKQNHALEQRAINAEQNQLPKAERELLTKFKALNLSIDDVSRIIGEHKQWGEERAKNAKLNGLKAAAEKAGLNAELLASLEGALDAEYSVVGEGDAAKAIVKVKSGDTVTDKALNDWVAEKWPSLAETLKAQPQNGSNQQQQRTVTSTHRGAPAGGGQAPNKFQAIRDEAEARKKNKQSDSTLEERMGLTTT